MTLQKAWDTWVESPIGGGFLAPETLPRTAFNAGWDAALVEVRKLHRPWRIYTDCECRPPHTQEDVEAGRAKDVWEIGTVCEDGFMYEVCHECCADDDYQTEECGTNHNHGADQPLCATDAILKDILKEEGL